MQHIEFMASWLLPGPYIIDASCQSILCYTMYYALYYITGPLIIANPQGEWRACASRALGVRFHGVACERTGSTTSGNVHPKRCTTSLVVHHLEVLARCASKMMGMGWDLFCFACNKTHSKHIHNFILFFGTLSADFIFHHIVGCCVGAVGGTMACSPCDYAPSWRFTTQQNYDVLSYLL